MKRFLPPEGDGRTQAARGKRREERNRKHAGQLRKGYAAQQQHQRKKRESGGQQDKHAQQAGQQPAQHQLAIGQIGHQQQHERLAVFLVGNGAGREQGREEDGQGQLQRGDDLEQDRSEAGQIAGVADQLCPGDHLPGRPHQQQQDARVDRPGHVMPNPSGGGDRLAGKDRTSKQLSESPVAGVCPKRTAVTAVGKANRPACRCHQKAILAIILPEAGLSPLCCLFGVAAGGIRASAAEKRPENTPSRKQKVMASRSVALP